MVILTIFQTVANVFISAEFVISTNITIYGESPAIQIQLTEIIEIYRAGFSRKIHAHQHFT